MSAGWRIFGSGARIFGGDARSRAAHRAVLATSICASLLVAGSAQAATLTVTRATGGTSDPGSLPYEVAHAGPGDQIGFDIGGGGPATIQLPGTLVIGTPNLSIVGSPDPTQAPASPLISVTPAAGATGSGIAVRADGITIQDISMQGFGGDGIEVDGASRTSIVSTTSSPSAIAGNGGEGIRVNAAASADDRFGGYRIEHDGAGPFSVSAPAFAVAAAIGSSGSEVSVTVTGASPDEPITMQAGADPGCAGSFDPYAGNTATATTDASGDATMTATVAPPARAPDGVRILVSGQNDGTVPVSGCVVSPLAPGAAITAPAPGSIVAIGQTVPTRFSCHDGAGGPGVRTCTDSLGSAAPGGRLDTARPGPHVYTVTAISADGRAASTSVSYTVAAAPVIRLLPVRPRYRRGARVRVRFSCREGRFGPGLVLCRGSIRSGAMLPTRRVGIVRVTITAVSRDGQRTHVSVRCRIERPPVHRRPPRRGRRAGHV